MTRLVVLPWTCLRSGDCCQGPALVVSQGEKATLERLADQALAPLVWQRHVDPAFVVLKGTPCPFLDESPTPACRIYDERPMNCRRFACYRPTRDEPLEPGGPLGCQNALDRFRQSPAVQADYQAREKAAQVWGWKRGWSRE